MFSPQPPTAFLTRNINGAARGSTQPPAPSPTPALRGRGCDHALPRFPPHTHRHFFLLGSFTTATKSSGYYCKWQAAALGSVHRALCAVAAGFLHCKGVHLGSHPTSPAQRWGDAAGRMSGTSSVGVSPVGEPPDVAEPHAVPDAGEEEIQAARPVPSVLGALGAQVPVGAAGAHQELRCHRLEERGSRGWERLGKQPSPCP